jgi:PAS domain S-box-containing protein
MALRASAMYFIIASLWIILSDRALHLLSSTEAFHLWAQSFKGLVFVAVSSGLVYAIIYTATVRQQRDENALRASEEELRGSFDLAPIGMAQADLAAGKLLRVNRKMCEITGYTEGELLGMSLFDLCMADARERDWSAYLAMAQGRSQEYASESRCQRKDGAGICVLMQGTLVHDAAGASLRCVVSMQDVTQQRAAESALRSSESRFRELADAMPQMVFTAGPDGVADYFNLQWQRYVGMTVAEARETQWRNIIHPDDFHRVSTSWFASIAADEPHSIEYRIRPANGSDEYHWHLSRALPARDEAGNVVKWFGTITDIHAQKRAADEIEQLNATLEQRVVDRTRELQAVNEELDAFSYTVSHDLRAPLHTLQGFATTLLARQGDKLDEQGLESLRRVIASSARMDRLITDLLEYSRLARADLALSPVSTVTIVHELIGQLQREPEMANAAIHFQEPLPWVLGHRLTLQHVFANLIGNAIKFVQPGERAKVNIWAEERTDVARIWIEDRGIGISPENFERIFTPFESLNENGKYQGAGIGLAIAKRAVERMGGRVGVRSTEGAGSQFWVELPLVKSV